VFPEGGGRLVFEGVLAIGAKLGRSRSTNHALLLDADSVPTMTLEQAQHRDGEDRNDDDSRPARATATRLWCDHSRGAARAATRPADEGATSAARIRAEQSLPILERWAIAAREVGRVAELFDLQ
jgi:hypothetical protein